ncbi:hypothetical protein Tco_1387238 [Tanacetum coccineum]
MNAIHFASKMGLLYGLLVIRMRMDIPTLETYLDSFVKEIQFAMKIMNGRYDVSMPALHKKPQRIKELYVISRRPLYAVFYFKYLYILDDIEHGPFSKKTPNTPYRPQPIRHIDRIPDTINRNP